MAKATKSQTQQLAYFSADCCFLLSHLIRQNSKRCKTKAQAFDILCAILNLKHPYQKPMLKAARVGWYASNKRAKLYDINTGELQRPKQIRAVCFTESTLTSLKAHCEIFNIQYGLAFERDYLFRRGANPCININKRLLHQPVTENCKVNQPLFQYIPEKLAGYVNIISGRFDATHEREWRLLGDLRFDYQDIKFLFCPEQEFPMFSQIQHQGLPVLFDLAWLNRAG